MCATHRSLGSDCVVRAKLGGRFPAHARVVVMDRADRALPPTPVKEPPRHAKPVAQAGIKTVDDPSTCINPGPQDGGEGNSSSSDVDGRRTKSVSSISSANSTSSIEAVPFRAPPCGNVRPQLDPRWVPIRVESPSVFQSSSPRLSLSDHSLQALPTTPFNGSQASADVRPDPRTPILRPESAQGSTRRHAGGHDMAPPPFSPTGPVVKQRVLPKQPTDRWMYRNGPGQSRRLPMLGPVEDDDARRQMSRSSSRNSLAVPDGSSSQRSSVSDTHQRSMEATALSGGSVDEDARSHLSSSSLTTLAAQSGPSELLPASKAASTTSVDTETPSQHYLYRDSSSHARALHWLRHVQQHQRLHGDESPERQRTSDDTHRTSHVRHSDRSSLCTLMPRSPSPRVPLSDTSSVLLETPPMRCMQLQSAEDVRFSRATSNSNSTSDSSRASSRRRTTSDFVFGEVLGEGSYSTVIKAWDVHDWPDAERQVLVARATALNAAAGQAGSMPVSDHMPKAYAVKILDKVHILKEKKQKYVRVEKEALSLLVNTPGVVTLYHTFQDRESLYFVLELAPNCELLHYVQKYGSLDLDSATFYGAQLADAIDRIHRAGVVHRDIKPENVLLDGNMRVLVTDFGSARVLGRSADSLPDERTHSFVGTAEYVSPELLNDQVVGMPADWWAFGCVFFQMIAGHAPFRAANEYQTFQKILHRSFAYPVNFPSDARILIDALLCLDPNVRATAKDVKRNVIFHSIDFATLWTIEPPQIRPDYMQRPQSDESETRALAELDERMNDLGCQREDSFASLEPSSVTDDSSVASSSELPGRKAPPSRSTSSSSRAKGLQHKGQVWTDLLLPSEDVVFSSPMLLRRSANTGMFARKCQMILTTLPRLCCIKETSRSVQVLADIPLCPPQSLPSKEPPISDPTRPPTILVRSESRRSAQSQSRLHRSQSTKSRMQALSRTLGLRSKQEDDYNDCVKPLDRVMSASGDASGSWPVQVDLRGQRGFVLQTPERQWQFEDPAGDAPFWVQSILESLQSQPAVQ